MIAAAMPRAGVPIRLTAERWAHIVEEHAELAGLREEALQTIAATLARIWGEPAVAASAGALALESTGVGG